MVTSQNYFKCNIANSKTFVPQPPGQAAHE